MKKLTPNDPEMQSADLLVENVERLKALFPEAFTEGKIDFAVLKELLGGHVDEREEKYGLNWHGKRQARRLALTPSTGTLRPCPEESVDWQTTQNLMIEGDNLEVLKLLQKSYAGRVKLIYIDPPYNTGKDFVYPDDYRDNIHNYLELTGQVDGEGRRMSSNTEASGRFHTDWLNMMYPRLRLARNLLREDGVLFISIDDGELANLQILVSEIFGDENFQANISWQKRYTRSNNTVDFTTVVEHILVYSRDERFNVNLLERTDEADSRYSNPDNDPRGPWKGASFLNPATPQQRPNLCYQITNPKTGQVTAPTTNAWRRSRDEFIRMQNEGILYWGSDGMQPIPSIKMFLSEARNITPINLWEHEYAGNTDDGTKELKELFEGKFFDNPKPSQLIRRTIEHGCDQQSIILDFFAGSGTTGHAVMAQNAADGGSRRYILVQLPEPLDPSNKDQKTATDFCDRLGNPRTIAELTKERLRRAGKKIKQENPLFHGDIGFRVFKLDASNLKPWDPNPADLNRTLLDHVDHILPDRSEQDLLFELLLKLGLELTVPMETRTIAGKAVHAIGGGALLVCLSEDVTRQEVELLAQGLLDWRRELAPAVSTTFVFRDNAFDDVGKTNLAAILEQNLPASELAGIRSL
ncbi:MAG: site-specific DNA-methyltransferase [Magnetococcales bacterium]|nr:site-specific DNA-methyltransferase [Magnetococcales bacterium]